MSETKVRKPKQRVRLLVGALALAAFAPSLAVANHTTCTTGRDESQPARSTDCPEISPELEAKVDLPYIDTPAQVQMRYYQADHESTAYDVTLYYPKGWRFAVNSVKPGEAPGGLPATECKDMFTGSKPATLARGELLSAGQGLKARFAAARTVATYGFTSARRPSLTFMRWNEITKVADLCLYLYSDSGVDTTAQEYFIPVTLTRLDGDPLYGWSARVDLSQIARTQWAYNNAFSITEAGLHFNHLSGGNWNRNPVNGNLERVYFSRTPYEPVTGELTAVFSACREGLNNPSLSPDICRNNNVVTIARSQTVNITLPPDSFPLTHDFGKLTGVGGVRLSTGCGSSFTASCPGLQPVGFSVVKGTQEVTVGWTPASAGTDDTVKGYVLVVAEPNVQDSKHYNYFVTQSTLVDQNNLPVGPNPAFPTDPARQVCGADGKATTCSFVLRFPLTGIGGKVLDGNAKYDLALVTIYADGHRSDGRCDDGTGDGVICDPNLPAFKVTSPGVSAFQFLLLARNWPNWYHMTAGNVPTYLLFTDYAQKHALVVTWGGNVCQGTPAPSATTVPFMGWFCNSAGSAKDKAASFYFAGSNLMQGNDTQGGLISFGNFKPDGSAASFRFDGWTSPSTNLPCGTAQRGACGVFTIYDPRNWTLGLPSTINPTNPTLNPCIGTAPGGTCSPTFYSVQFSGTKG